RHVDVGKARQAGAQQMGVAGGRHDQELKGFAVAPMLGERFDQEACALQIAPALNLAQSQGENGLADLSEHPGGTENTCETLWVPHQSLEAIHLATYQRRNVPHLFTKTRKPSRVFFKRPVSLKKEAGP